MEVSGFRLSRIEYTFSGSSYSIHTSWLLLLTAAVGIMGGAYGVGGGAIIAPFLVSFFRLPARRRNLTSISIIRRSEGTG